MDRTSEMECVNVVGAGLAGCEAAYQLAKRGIPVKLIEMKTVERTPAQQSDFMAELVCSNSLRSQNVRNAVGLLKEEMRRLDSLVIEAARYAAVPAGDALAVDRERFGGYIENTLKNTLGVQVEERICEELPKHGHTIVATGPLTHKSLASDLPKGDDTLYFYDALAPIVSADGLNLDIIFAQSRYDKGQSADYLNIPLDKACYENFIDDILGAECMPLHDFEKPKYFQGCMPIEVLAQQGRETLRFGCMKPVGLSDPRGGSSPHAVIQLRKEDIDGQSYNLVGFQTKLKWPEQKRIFRKLPGLESAEFLRLGAIHRNTYVNAPLILDPTMRLHAQPNCRLAGQITGVEGYVESAAHGLLTALFLADDLGAQHYQAPPRDTALGALLGHVTGEYRTSGAKHEPQNINWSMFPPTATKMRKRDKQVHRIGLATNALESWAKQNNLPLSPSEIDFEALVEDLPRRKRLSS